MDTYEDTELQAMARRFDKQPTAKTDDRSIRLFLNEWQQQWLRDQVKTSIKTIGELVELTRGERHTKQSDEASTHLSRLRGLQDALLTSEEPSHVAPMSPIVGCSSDLLTAVCQLLEAFDRTTVLHRYSVKQREILKEARETRSKAVLLISESKNG
jgi:hypothetical protein